MGYFAKEPAARRAFFAKWRDVWKRRCESGGFDRSEEEDQRRDLLQEVAGVRSSNDLSREGYSAVMLAMSTELNATGGDPGEPFRDPDRARMVAKIERTSAALSKSDDGDKYVGAIVGRKFPSRNPVNWRKELTAEELKMVMLDLVSQERREKRRKAGAGS